MNDEISSKQIVKAANVLSGLCILTNLQTLGEIPISLEPEAQKCPVLHMTEPAMEELCLKPRI